jgi:hypothetical protein
VQVIRRNSVPRATVDTVDRHVASSHHAKSNEQVNGGDP